MKNILNLILLLCAVLVTSACTKVPDAGKANASFVAQKLDLDGKVIESSSTNLSVSLVTKTINGVDQKVALVGFEFTGSADHVSIWTGDSCKVKVPTKVDGITLEPTEYGYQIAASDYEKYLADDFTQKGIELTNGKLSYKYWKAGTYKAYMVATNVNEYSSNGMKRDTKFITITVTQ
jgi:hypothetical protein